MDLDIDKAYMMGYGVNNIGMFQHWSKLADYTTQERARLSDELPVPNGKRIVLSNDARSYSGNVNSLIFADGNNRNPELIRRDFLRLNPNFMNAVNNKDNYTILNILGYKIERDENGLIKVNETLDLDLLKYFKIHRLA